MKFTRRAVQATIALGLLGGLFATPGFAQDKPKVALVMKSLANEFFQTMEAGAQAHNKANASEYTLVSNGIKNETDTAAQIRMVEQMIAQKANAIVIAPADSKALVPVLKTAIDKGILVVNIDNQLDPAVQKEKGIQIPFAGPDNRTGAKLVGDYLAKQLKAGDKVGILEGVSTTFNAQQRTLGFNDAMKAASVSVVGVQSGDWEINKGNTVASGMLREHPDLKALLAGNDNMAIGAVAAVKAAGKTGKVMVVGYDNIDAVKPMLKDGRMLATADQFGAKQAVFGIEIALKALKEKKKQSEMPAAIQTDVVLVTKDSK
ncbi:sugar ABC transporter substrate-binding protein [Rhodoferax sp. U2-2l]|uniref:sugar ABC transporter substrate-binding protein n=1 Tax=Rhodoferax sp. U2-2l TaxID=2884000 RepID=UPI001D0AE3E2|nr:sugar ABC transporter substrate-binding protein [Rhodoferax sp. U2-2l]MCB8745412.1 sugar ABC transporter substrate-binding protein [Rhodoferax sp. U2-2l]